MKKEYIFPIKVLTEKCNIENSETLLSQGSELQRGLVESNYAVLHCGSALVLDFGKKYCGGVHILTYRVAMSSSHSFWRIVRRSLFRIGRKGINQLSFST